MQTHFDVIIIGAGASGLFTAIESSKKVSKLILEKNKNPGTKVLLSGGERANVSNIDIDLERDYFGQNKKALFSMFKKYSNYDFLNFLEENSIKTVIEDRGRIILESGNSRELLNLLLKKALNNNTKILYENSVIDISYINNNFEILVGNGDRFSSKKLVISTGGKTFSHLGTTGDGYEWSKNLGHTVLEPHRGLCGLVTKKDLSEISGISCELDLDLIYISSSKEKIKVIYNEKGPLLFTHFGVSGPIVFNSSVALGEHKNSINLDEFISMLDFSKIPEHEKLDHITKNFIKNHIVLKLKFDLEITPKKIISFFNLTQENKEIFLELQDYRTWKEAKVTSGGINIDELTPNLESKIIPGLYFTGEILDITGKTGGYNLQLCWTTGSIVGKSL